MSRPIKKLPQFGTDPLSTLCLAELLRGLRIVEARREYKVSLTADDMTADAEVTAINIAADRDVVALLDVIVTREPESIDEAISTLNLIGRFIQSGDWSDYHDDLLLVVGAYLRSQARMTLRQAS